MSKAEIIEHEGYEVPNWVLKCKALINNGRTLGVLAFGLLLIAGFAYWNHNQPAFSDTTQTHPSTTPLPVTQSGLSLPQAAPVSNITPPATDPTSTSGTSLLGNAAAGSPVGPAPTDLVQSLQPSGGAVTNSAVPGLTGAVTGTTQAAGAASNALVNSLGL